MPEWHLQSFVRTGLHVMHDTEGPVVACRRRGLNAAKLSDYDSRMAYDDRYNPLDSFAKYEGTISMEDDYWASATTPGLPVLMIIGLEVFFHFQRIRMTDRFQSLKPRFDTTHGHTSWLPAPRPKRQDDSVPRLSARSCYSTSATACFDWRGAVAGGASVRGLAKTQCLPRSVGRCSTFCSLEPFSFGWDAFSCGTPLARCRRSSAATVFMAVVRHVGNSARARTSMLHPLGHFNFRR